MSGQKLAVPVVASAAPASAAVSLLPIVGGVVLVAGVAVVSAMLLNRIARKLDENEKEARRQMAEDAERRKRMHEEAQRREQQQKALELAREQIAEAARRMARWEAPARPNPPASPPPDAPPPLLTSQTANPVSPTRPSDPAALQTRLNDLADAIETLPPEFQNQRPNVRQNLRDYHRRLTDRLRSSQPPDAAELDSFHETIRRTLQSALNEMERFRQKQDAARQKAEDLLQQITAAVYMAQDPRLRERLQIQQNVLLNIMAGETIPEDDLELLEQVFKPLAQETVNGIAQRAAGDEAADRVALHLRDLGYTTVESFQIAPGSHMRRALFAIPGGGLLRAAIHPDNQISFQVARPAAPGAPPPSPEELHNHHLRELRWSRDYNELTRRLREDGFDYRTALLEFAQAHNIPVVEYRSADHIAGAPAPETETEDDDLRRRYDPAAPRRFHEQ